jgi:hypothetical protein
MSGNCVVVAAIEWRQNVFCVPACILASEFGMRASPLMTSLQGKNFFPPFFAFCGLHPHLHLFSFHLRLCRTILRSEHCRLCLPVPVHCSYIVSLSFFCESTLAKRMRAALIQSALRRTQRPLRLKLRTMSEAVSESASSTVTDVPVVDSIHSSE